MTKTERRLLAAIAVAQSDEPELLDNLGLDSLVHSAWIGRTRDSHAQSAWLVIEMQLRIIRINAMFQTLKLGNAMYICLCNALTDRRLKDAVSQESNQNAADVYAACGCRAKCGQCVRVVKELLRQRDAMAEDMTAASV